MSELVAKWIQHRLGLIVDMSPDNFAIKTANGHLLAQILHSYQIIVTEQLNLIIETDIVQECYENFKHIKLWLRDLNITLEDEDLYEVAHGVGTASLHLFYRVLLELKDKTQLDFLTDNEINAQLGTKFTRFNVSKVDTKESPNKVDLHGDEICEPLLFGGDVYHWYKDRMENLQNRCKEAREEYIHILKTRCRPCTNTDMPGINESGFVLARSLITSPKPSCVLIDPNQLPDEIISYDDERTYNDLVNEQKEAQQMQPVKPDSKEVKRIMKNLKDKRKTRHENKIMRNELHQEIMNEFDRKINESKQKSEDKVLTRIFMRQTCFEKELVSKLGQIKMQREFMIENKFKQAEALNKLKEKEFVDSVLLQEKELNENKLFYYLEKQRILQLHRKIWENRLRLRAKRHEITCSNAVKDLVDIAIKISEHKARFGQEPSRREMNELKNIFLSGEPPFDICEPVVNIIKNRDWSEDLPEEQIITMETMRQNALDQEEFDSYMHYEWPWEIKNVECTSEMLEHISCGLNVLGLLVYRVLLAKYPPPPPREKPYFPDVVTRVCVNGLNDLSCIPTLRNLLLEREIEVVELSQVVNFCLEAYQQESKREHDEDEIVPIKESRKKKERADKLPKKGEKPKSKSKIKIENVEQVCTKAPKEFENKTVQTPIIFPCEEINFTIQAILGKTAQEMLDLGRPLSDQLLMAMFVQYLRLQPPFKGWVLINYPTTYDQAAIIEEAFTGINILETGKVSPNRNIILEIADIEEKLDPDNENISCELESKRKSRLLPNPLDIEAVKVYDTFLTAYIKLKKMLYDERTGDAMLPPIFEELGDHPDPLEKFYSDAGANYSLYYKDFDINTVKYLGKLIIGDYSLPLKSSLELFGESMREMDPSSRGSKSLKATMKGEKMSKPKEKLTKSLAVSVPDSSDKKSTKEEKRGKGKVVIVRVDKYTQIPSEAEEEIEEVFMSDNTIQFPTAGQKGWDYTNVPCPEELKIALANLWETIEEIYVNDFKQVFFLKRLNMNCVMPFTQYVKDIMKKDIDKPDYKGFYLAKFQKAFNTFELDFRKDDEFKAEMYCRIEDFKEKLTEMCDEKMMDSEDRRCKTINGNWTVLQVTELFNNYVNMFQIELDRFTETIRFINDYFMGTFTGMPSEEELSKEDTFPKISELNPKIINDVLQNMDSKIDLSHFEDLLSSMIQKSNSFIKKLNTNTTSNMEKIKPAHASSGSKSKTGSPKSKHSKDDKKVTGGETDIIKENYQKLMEEWQCAIKGESLRISLRLELLKHNCLETIQELIETVRNCFHGIYNDLRSTYWEEVENIQNVCKVFRIAVENEKPVQKELIFVDHTFYINPEVNLFSNAPIIPELPKEVVEEGAFTIAQLSKLTDILMDLCPSGYMLRSSFIFLLQDIIWNHPDDGSDLMAPDLWRKLGPTGLKKVIDELHDDLEYVYWRDFIVYNLRLNYPTERELLLTRRNLRECDPDSIELVEDYQFYSTKMWFEYCYNQEDSNKLKDTKKLLRKIYGVKNCGINYTALLLDFCKDEHILMGFGKALDLSFGKLVCWNSDMGNTFEEAFLKNVREHDESVQLRDEERALYFKIAHDEVLKLVDYVVHIMEDVIIEDYVEEKPKLELQQDTVNKKSDETGKPRKSSASKPTEDIIEDFVDDKPKRKESHTDKVNKRKSDSGKYRRSSSKPANIMKNKTSGHWDATEFSHTAKNKDNISEEDNEHGENKNKEEENKDEKLKRISQITKIYKDLPNNVGTDASEFTQIMFFLPLDVLLIVITAALPWHSRIQVYEELSFLEQAVLIFEKHKNPNFNMSVLSHKFLNSNDFLNLLGKTKKFKATDPVRIVKNILDEKK